MKRKTKSKATRPRKVPVIRDRLWSMDSCNQITADAFRHPIDSADGNFRPLRVGDSVFYRNPKKPDGQKYGDRCEAVIVAIARDKLLAVVVASGAKRGFITSPDVGPDDIHIGETLALKCNDVWLMSLGERIALNVRNAEEHHGDIHKLMNVTNELHRLKVPRPPY